MKLPELLLACCVLAPAGAVCAQTPGTRTREQIEVSFEAHKGDFDYLLGDWEFTAESREFGKFRGYWSAVRLDEGQIVDEYRVVGDKGETYYVTTSLRNYNKFLDRWELVGADAGTGLQDMGTGRRVGAEMHIEQRFGVMSDKPSTWKIRCYNIGPDRFPGPRTARTMAGRRGRRSIRQSRPAALARAARAGTERSRTEHGDGSDFRELGSRWCDLSRARV
jgi:hypothetical protein